LIKSVAEALWNTFMILKTMMESDFHGIFGLLQE
jgi:hypothetical protein